jgi:hypothetical protein
MEARHSCLGDWPLEGREFSGTRLRVAMAECHDGLPQHPVICLLPDNHSMGHA